MPEVSKVKEELEERGYSEQEYNELAKLYEGTLSSITAGQIVKGRVVHIGDSSVSVDIGFKSEGSVAATEFTNLKDLKVGDQIEVFLESVAGPPASSGRARNEPET